MKKTTITEVYNEDGKLIKKETIIEEDTYIYKEPILPQPYINPVINPTITCHSNEILDKRKELYKKWSKNNV